MDTPDTPWASTRTPSSRPASHKSGRSSRSRRSQASSRTTEQTPLLVREDRSDDEDETEDHVEETPARSSLLRYLSVAKGDRFAAIKKRWPSILALFILSTVFVIILVGFLTKEAVEEYAMQAADFRPTKLSLDSLTATGVKVQVEGDFRMDASKVRKKSVRDLGRFGTWIAKEVESGPANVEVHLTDYDNVLVGTARIPSITVNIRNGHTNHISFFTDLEPGSFDGIRNVANDWLEGRLGDIRVNGKAKVTLKSGLIHLGDQVIQQAIVLSGKDVPSLPKYNISKINLREAKDGRKGMGADVSVSVTNDFPVQLTIPPVAVDLLVDGCTAGELIPVGTAETAKLHVEPKTDVKVNVTGHVEKLPDELTEACPNSAKSPLDSLLGEYMHGEDATVYVNCCKFPDPKTPNWARDLLKDIQVPIPFAGHQMGNLIKNFSLADVKFDFPDMFAEPGTPDSYPKISGIINVDINLPDEMNFPLDVEGVKAAADVFYHKKKLGELNLEKWQKANSTRIDAHGKEGPSLLVRSEIDRAPLKITDDDLFMEVVQALFFKKQTIFFDVKAAVSVKVDTPMGGFAVREIPAEGVIPVKPIDHGKGDKDGKPGNALSGIGLKMGNLSIVDTSASSIIFQAHVNFTNPTNYSASIPYFNLNILVNDTIIGQASIEDVLVHPGNNTDVIGKVVFDPYTNSGAAGKEVGRQWLSQYISGFNTSLTVQAHAGTIPAQPSLGKALSKFPITFPAPHMAGPKDPDDDDPSDPDDDDKETHFIRDATMHILSSTALFTLASPFHDTTLFITRLNATAYYEGHPSAKILYTLPFAVPPGLSTSPRLPVDWSIGSVGYDAIRKALGGTLKLSAFANVGIRIGKWTEDVWYKGRSIGANVRL